MTRYNFRDVQDRFGHIDGRVVSADVCFRPQDEVATARVVLSLYPWWEHPLYLAALAAGTNWGFDHGDEACREVVVEAIEPLLCELRPRDSAIDMVFHTEHPMLWEFEDTGQIFCNSDFEPRALLKALAERHMPNVDQRSLLRYLSPFPLYKAPFSLDRLPFTLFHHVKAELQRMNVRLFIASEPKARPSPIALSIDDGVVMVAKDFFLEVPEFEHRPKWFRPAST